jgi:hypothetical protein
MRASGPGNAFEIGMPIMMSAVGGTFSRIPDPLASRGPNGHCGGPHGTESPSSLTSHGLHGGERLVPPAMRNDFPGLDQRNATQAAVSREHLPHVQPTVGVDRRIEALFSFQIGELSRTTLPEMPVLRPCTYRFNRNKCSNSLNKLCFST